MELKGKNILVLGAGKSGVAAANFSALRGAAKVVLSDVKPRAKFDEPALELEKKGVVIESDGHKESTMLEADIIIVSPGVPVDKKWRELAARHNKLLVGELEFASRFTKARIVAITGTNGKTTTTTLTYEILKAQLGSRVALAGNIGIAFCDILTQGTDYDYIVLEVSSFQLETAIEFNPYIAMILNITDDHMDRYASMQEYAEAKARIFKNHTQREFLILNAEDRFTPIMQSMAGSSKVLFSVKRELNDGYFFSNNGFYKNVFGQRRLLFGADGLWLKGPHNMENIMACLIVSDILGLDQKKTEATVKGFKGLPHRIEFVAQVNGKAYYDDSKGTNTDAVVRAVEAFTEETVLILGGREKNTDWSQLINVLPRNIKTIVALGENRDKIEQLFSEKAKVIKTESMEEAVKKASEVESAKVVLLSPGCASFDLFRNYAHRGDEFKKYVQKLVP